MTDTPETETGTALALFPKLNLPSVAGVAEQMNKTFGTMYTRIEAGIAELPTDMSVAANRDKVRSYAYSISRTKTGLDDAAADVAGEAKTIVDTVNAERRQLKSTLDMLRDKARAPLDAWEAKIEAQEKATADKLEDFASELSTCRDQSSVFIADTMGEIAAEIYCEEVFGEAGAEQVEEERRITLQKMADMRTAKVRQEEEAAELEQLRREKAEREAAEAARKAEEERKEREAAEAKRQEEERARIAKEAEERAAREAAEKIEAERREKEAAEQRAKEAEERAAKAAEDAKRREIEAQERQKEAAARAEEDAKRREAAAKEEERQRIERERLAKERADQERAADEAHRRKINGEIVAAMMKAFEVNETFARQIVVAIYKGQVPHVTINY